eukprot:CAMPEP_0113300352 /NCGR_PEP_ID=MMETSP0010_2-20120614/2018_1 /TAXON_ID=216773 ORGANISM="Corethron hystrix, Strain 308" /NCGR_SAMPLE_ID=MMETSP0010_2 /ASSEMBLY_ACC=CAM_ASM_000155 /LENGTH=375 /DNA_ID=CAMNT_0000153763 /DNA_START=494 /DNA_END=1618 /DNA_ORIENTATION=+ /assembly_acc=CAM_ASM_000155
MKTCHHIVFFLCANTISSTTCAFIGKLWKDTRVKVASRNKPFKNISQPNLVRGDRYRDANSTIPSPKVIAESLGVKPTKEASAKTWQRAWKIHKRMLPLLHSTDNCKPPDSSLNLACMWWKSLSGNDKSSPVYDNGLAYDLLPSGWRKIVRLRRLYPRLHHANVEMRTAYLDSQINEIVQNVRGQNNEDGGESKRIRLICMGAGYDTRGVKMLERNTVDEVIELDLTEVVRGKERLFDRLRERRPWLKDLTMPTPIPSDFNDVGNLRKKLDAILKDNNNTEKITNWHTIFTFEGVMIYLDDGVPSSLLSVTSNVLNENNLDGSLCFADRLENVPGGDFDLGAKELKKNGWIIKDWCPKPGLARHMGSAELLKTLK